MKRFSHFFTGILLVMVIFFNINKDTSAQIPQSQIDNLNIILDNAELNKSQFDRLSINARNVNLTDGNVSQITMSMLGLHRKDIILDELRSSINDIYFSTDELFTKQTFSLNRPVKANVTLVVTEQSINTMLNQKNVLEKLTNVSQTTIKKFGIPINAGLISFNQPKASLLNDNKVRIDMIASLANFLNFPVSFITRLNISNGQLTLSSPELISSGITLPSDIASKINDKLNEILASNNKIEDDLALQLTNIEVLPAQRIILNADVLIRKLYLGKKPKG